jgi:uncharacterized Zn finger protein (UPF0148 family)
MSGDGKERDSVNLKEAASLLTKGGTLINDPCGLCSGVQVKFRDRIICINCGNEKSAFNKSDSNQQEKQERQLAHSEKSGQLAGTRNPESLKKDLERHSEQVIDSSRRDFNGLEMEPQERQGNQERQSERAKAGQESLQNVSFLLSEKIASEIGNIKEAEDTDLLRRKAETIRILLGLLQKVKEIERL